MNEMLERVAAVLRGPGAACLMSERDSLDAAREILVAMREPTEAMIDAADGVDVFGAHTLDFWCAMIHAALDDR